MEIPPNPKKERVKGGGRTAQGKEGREIVVKLKVDVRGYRRRFRRPLETAHGLWRERRGFLIRIDGGEGRYGFGEVAPTPWLGSESLEEAEAFLRSLRGEAGPEALGAIGRLPACRFGIDSAMADLREESVDLAIRPLKIAALLPAGRRALEALGPRLAAGYRTFKWKIGVEPGDREREIFRELRANAPAEAVFRLDANGCLAPAEVERWLAFLGGTGAEFLEQPLAAGAFEAMLELAKTSPVPIALDESVGGARAFERAHRRKWCGLYVVKPAIFGAMREARALLPPLRPRLIFSSVFETSIGFEAVLRWASRWQAEGCAAGLGTGEFLEEDGLFRHPVGPRIVRGLVDPARVWERAGELGEG